MERAFSRRYVVLALVFIFALVLSYLTLWQQPNSAQERPAETPKAKFEQFARADEITNVIRDKSKEIVRVQFRSITDRENVTKYGQIVQDFGGSVVLAKDRKTDLSRMDVQSIETSINLPGSKFDPLQSAPVETIRPGTDAKLDRGYYIVQLGGVVIDDWLDSLRDAGVEIVQYVPHQAYFVYGEGAAIAKIAGHSRVRWVGAYQAEQKLSPEVMEFSRSTEGSTASYDVAVFSRADLGVVASQVGGRTINTSKLPNNFFNVVRVELAKADLERIADLPDVFRIDPYIVPTKEDERSSQIIAGNYSSTTVISGPGYNPLTQFGADGTGVTVMVSDDGISIPGNGGFYITANNTVHGPLRGGASSASGGHGHINASIIAGSTPFGVLDSLNYNFGLGVAPNANIINIPFLANGTHTDAQAVDDALTTLGPNGARGTISNNSWGSGTNGNSYDSLAATYDGLVRDGSFAGTIDPFSIIFSAGNCGNSPGGSACNGQNGLTRPKVSKNTIAVANTENLRPEAGFGPTSANNIDDLTSSSSRGPAVDGRVKPDISAPGSVITGSRAGTCGTVTSCFDPNHAWSSGTSHAAPQVAGAAALFTQYYRNNNAGTSPRPSLIKASIISSAQEMNANNTASVIPNGTEGWGRINMKLMMNTGIGMRYVNEETTLSEPATTAGFTGSVSNSTKPLRVTLVWTDPPGVGNPALVNNLDLTVSVNGIEYKGNVFTSGSSSTGGSYDTINNVENVFLPAGLPVGTPVVVSVRATALNGDGVIGNGDATDQHYSLVAYNVGDSSVTDLKPPVDFDGDDKTDISIFRNDMHRWWVYRSSDNVVFGTALGAITTPGLPLPADYTGDGKADVAVWRESDGTWFIQRSEDFSYFTTPFGTSGDKPVPADYDGDSKADRAVYRPSTGTWYIQRTSDAVVQVIPFGNSTDIPVPGDYDGDTLTDVAIYRPSAGQWWINRSTAGVIVFTFGTSTDKLVPGDYTGDLKTDVALWRPSTGEWYVLRSEDFSYFSVPFGSTGDLPTPGDYDGDDKTDVAVFRPSSATWFVNRSTAGIHIQNFGLTTDIPLPNVFTK